METVYLTLQSVLAFFVTILILMQLRGSGISGRSGSASFSRRGLDKLTFKLTFLASILFTLVSVLALVS